MIRGICDHYDLHLFGLWLGLEICLSTSLNPSHHNVVILFFSHERECTLSVLRASTTSSLVLRSAALLHVQGKK